MDRVTARPDTRKGCSAGDVDEQLDRLDEVNPEAAVMFRELLVAAARAEERREGSSRELVAEYRERWGADEVLDAGQIEEVRAWLASR